MNKIERKRNYKRLNVFAVITTVHVIGMINLNIFVLFGFLVVGGKVVVVLVVVVVVGAGVVVVVVVVVVGQTCEREKSKSTSQIVTHTLQ